MMMLFANSLDHNHIVQEAFDYPFRKIQGFLKCHQMGKQINSRHIKIWSTLNFYYILLIYFAFHSTHVVIRGQLVAISSLLLPCGTQDISFWPLSLEAGAFPIEPSCQSHFIFEYKITQKTKQRNISYSLLRWKGCIQDASPNKQFTDEWQISVYKA